jgi:2-oxoglutarate dehydrogenase E2 component (dihydrolipoamide succinyltransferase)
MNIILPAMGEGVIEAIINKWLVKAGAEVKEDDPLVEVATDKVDSEIPAPSAGIILEIKAAEGSVVKIGDTIAILENNIVPQPEETIKIEKEVERIRETIEADRKEKKEESVVTREMKSRTPSGKFLSPLVRNIAAHEGISYSDLDKITGTGMDGRITRDDILKMLEEGKKKLPEPVMEENQKIQKVQKGEDEVIEMDRVRKLIAEHMVMSKRTSPHVTSFIDADVTRMVNWRNSAKEKFSKRMVNADIVIDLVVAFLIWFFLK